MSVANLKRASARGQHEPSSWVSRRELAPTNAATPRTSTAYRDGLSGCDRFQPQYRLTRARLRGLPAVCTATGKDKRP